jgi:hypothetical protein
VRLGAASITGRSTFVNNPAGRWAAKVVEDGRSLAVVRAPTVVAWGRFPIPRSEAGDDDHESEPEAGAHGESGDVHGGHSQQLHGARIRAAGAGQMYRLRWSQRMAKKPQTGGR